MKNKFILFFIIVFVFNNCGGNSSNTADDRGIPPSTPEKITGECIYYNTIRLTWGEPKTDVEKYIISRSENDDDFKEIAKVDGSFNSYDDINLIGTNRYTYKIQASNKFGQSPYTEQICFKPGFNVIQIAQVNKEIFQKYFPDSDLKIHDVVFKQYLNNQFPSNVQFFDEPQLCMMDKDKSTITVISGNKSLNSFINLNIVKKPRSIFLTHDNELYVSDEERQVLIKFKIIDNQISFDKELLDHIKISDIASDGNSNIYLLDETSQSIIIIDQDDKVSNIFAAYENQNFIGLKAIEVDSNYLYVLTDFGKKLLVFNSEFNLVSSQYFSNAITADDIALTNSSIYIVSQLLNRSFIIDKNTLTFKGEFSAINYGEPWGKINGMYKISGNMPYGLFVIIDKYGTTGWFMEKAFTIIHQ